MDRSFSFHVSFSQFLLLLAHYTAQKSLPSLKGTVGGQWLSIRSLSCGRKMSSVKGRCCTDIRLLRLARIPRFSFDLLATFFCEIFFLSAETHRWTRLYVGIAALFFFLATFGRFHFIFFLCKRSGQQRRGEKTTITTTWKKRKEITKFQKRIAGWKESRISGLDESSRTHVTPHSLSLFLSICIRIHLLSLSSL